MDDNPYILEALCRGTAAKFYVVRRGSRCQVREFLERDKHVTRTEYEAAIELIVAIAHRGWSENPAKVKKLHSLTGRLWELKPSKHLRILCTRSGKKCVLLRAFWKSRRETPRKEIRAAETLIRELSKWGLV